VTLADCISPGSDWVQLGSERKHIVSYLGEFLFPAQRLRSPISMLSGGERNRLLLARLFAQPANLVILDEPTNDLDIESLELLEERLQDYRGTLLLVSHDRRFLDNVVTQTLVAEGNGAWREYAGGYSDYLQQRPPMPVGGANAAGQKPARHASRDRSAGGTPVKTRTRLSYRDERELAALPEKIESLEREQTELTARMSEPDYHRLGGERLRGDRKRLAELEELLLEKFARWESLEERRTRSV
jgi:ABC transport system ATP-binding/permease protein